MKTYPPNRERIESDGSSAPSIHGVAGTSAALRETPAASSRLDNIIHQPIEKETAQKPATGYNLAEVRHQDRTRVTEPISMEQQLVVTSVHHADNKDDDEEEEEEKNKASQQIRRNVAQRKSSSSSSSSHTEPHSSSSRSQSVTNLKTTITRPNDNLNIHRSFESLQDTYKNNQGMRPPNKTGSLELRNRPVQYDNQGS